MRDIPFEKFHALGNDFIVVDLTKTRVPEVDKARFTQCICDRHRGVGADGVVFFSLQHDRFAMRIFNADGGEAELSGNGLRILTHYLMKTGVTRKRSFEVLTCVGSNRVVVGGKYGSNLVSSVSLPAAKFETSLVPMNWSEEYFINSLFTCDAGELIGTAVNVGNPHIVFFVDNFDFNWREFGMVVETAAAFPEHANVEFARIKSRKEVDHRIWERGAGETSASGSGSAAVVSAGVMNGLLDHEVKVNEPAGTLQISISALGDPIMITGPTCHICGGSFRFDKNA